MRVHERHEHAWAFPRTYRNKDLKVALFSSHQTTQNVASYVRLRVNCNIISSKSLQRNACVGSNISYYIYFIYLESEVTYDKNLSESALEADQNTYRS